MASFTKTGPFTGLDTVITTLDADLLSEGWTKWRTIDPLTASYDIVFRATGATNDARAYVRITRTAASSILFRAYSFWNNLSDTGGFNETGQSTQTEIVFADDTAITLWVSTDEYSCTFFFDETNTGTDFGHVSFGWADRAATLPTHSSGWALTSAPVSNGASVVIPLDRDVTANLRVGQQVSIVSQDIIGSGGAAFEANLVVEAVTATNITLSITNDYGSLALIGLDPQPSYVTGSSKTTLIGYFVWGGEMAHAGAIAHPSTLRPLAPNGITEAGLDSFALGLIPGFPTAWHDGAASAEVLRGGLKQIHAVAQSATIYSIGDRLLFGAGGANETYMPLANQLIFAANEGSYIPVLGPFATP